MAPGPRIAENPADSDNGHDHDHQHRPPVVAVEDPCLEFLQRRADTLWREGHPHHSRRRSADVTRQTLEPLRDALANDVAACQELRWSQFSFPPLPRPRPPAAAPIPPIRATQLMASGGSETPPLIHRLAGARAGPGVRLEVRETETGETRGRQAALVLYDVEEKQRPQNGGGGGALSSPYPTWYGNHIRDVVLQERQVAAARAAREEASGVLLQFPFTPFAPWSPPVSLLSFEEPMDCGGGEEGDGAGTTPARRRWPAFPWTSHIISPSPREPYPMLRFLFHPNPTTRRPPGSGGAPPSFVRQYLRGSVALDPSPTTATSRADNMVVTEALQPSSPLLIASMQQWEEDQANRRIRLNVAYGRVIRPPPPPPPPQRLAIRKSMDVDNEEEEEDADRRSETKNRAGHHGLMTPAALLLQLLGGGAYVWNTVRRELFGWVRVLQVEAGVGGGRRGGAAKQRPNLTNDARAAHTAAPSAPPASLTVTEHDSLKLRLGGEDPRWTTALHLRHSEVVVVRSPPPAPAPPVLTTTTTTQHSHIVIPNLPTPFFPSSSAETVWSAFLSREYDSATRHYAPLTVEPATMEGDVGGNADARAAASASRSSSVVNSVRLVASSLRFEAGVGTAVVTPTQAASAVGSARGSRHHRRERQAFLPTAGVFAKAVSEGWCTVALPHRLLLTCRQHSGVLCSHPVVSPAHRQPFREEEDDETIRLTNVDPDLSHGLLTAGHTLSWPAQELRGWIYTGNEKGRWRDPRARWFAVLSAEVSRAPERRRSRSGGSNGAAHELPEKEDEVRTGGSRRQWSLFANVGWMGIPVKCDGSHRATSTESIGEGGQRQMWPKASVGLAIASNVPQMVLDTFSGLQYLRQEMTLSWMVDFSKSPFALRATGLKGSGEQMGPVWKRGAHEFFQHFRVGVTWKW